MFIQKQFQWTHNILLYKKKLSIPVEDPAEEPAEESATELKPERISWNEWLWEAAKSFGYSCQEFGEFILETVEDMGDWVYDNAVEIVETGLAIGGFLGILYIIAHIAPILVFA